MLDLDWRCLLELHDPVGIIGVTRLIKVAIHHLTNRGVGSKIGYVRVYDSPAGLVFDPQIFFLPPGVHGFHVHEFPDLTPKNGKPAGNAGQHFDPENTGKHLGPFQNGHLGDLPRLWVNGKGEAKLRVIAPRLQLSDVLNKSLIIHLKGDNYSDYPKKDGGGELRIAGGIITPDCPYCE